MNNHLANLNLANVVLSGKNASADFEEVAREVISLHCAVKEIEEEAANPDSILSRSGDRKKTELANILNHCGTALSQLEGLLQKYKSLGTKHKKKWDTIRLSSEGLADARSKITFHTSTINLFMATMGAGSLGRIEKKLDEIADDVRGGLRSDLSPETFSTDARWWLLQQELVTSGFEKENVATHKDWIQQRFGELIGHDEGIPATNSLSISPPRKSFAHRRSKLSPDFVQGGILDDGLNGHVSPSSSRPTTSPAVNEQPKFGPTLINLPPPPSEPASPASRNGAGSIDSLVGSVRSDVSVYDYQGRLTSRTVQVRQSFDDAVETAISNAERADRISRLAGLLRVATAKGITESSPSESFQEGVCEADTASHIFHSVDIGKEILPREQEERPGGQLVCTCCPKKPETFDTEGEVWFVSPLSRD